VPFFIFLLTEEMSMALVPILGPLIEPISVGELKTYLRLDGVSEEGLLAGFITTARLQIEAALSLALITQTWSWTFDQWPQSATVDLPMSPVQSITSITVTTPGSMTTLPSSAYVLDGMSIPARLITRTQWPQTAMSPRGIAITFAAGFGPHPSDVPPPLRQALLQLAAHWYSRRDADGACTGMTGAAITAGPLPPSVNGLLQPYRRTRL
jgi:uncharacterized phiE125 gp8 family phage protein